MYENDSSKEEHAKEIEQYKAYQLMESERNAVARANFIRNPYYCEGSSYKIENQKGD